VELSFIDEFEHGFGWTPAGDRLWRTAHAVRSGGSVWLTDVIDGPGIDERVKELGEPKGVVQLLDRHERDCTAVARRLDVPLHETPFDGVAGAPFEVIPVVRSRFWKEVALWFPNEQTLVVADALGTVSYFRAPAEPVGVHPFLRFKPPRRLAGYEPLHFLCGHGPGGHGEGVPEAVRQALAKPRRRLPQALFNGLREARRKETS
jgi:hypothetical protein